MITFLKRYVNKFLAASLVCILPLSSFMPVAFAKKDGGYEVYDINIIDEKRQEIRGWGVTPSGYQNDSFEEPPVTTRNAARSAVFNDLGITMFRMDLVADCGYSDGSLDEAWMDKYTQYLKACVDTGITQYMVSTWNPPAGMWYVNEQGKRTLYEEYEDNFCQFVVNAFNYTIKKGLPAPYAYSLQNEPQDGSKMVKYGDVQYIRVLKKMRKAFDENGLEDIILLAGETAAHYQQKVIFGINFSNLYNDPEFVDSIGAVITHSYVMTANSDDDDLYNFDMNLSNFPQLERWQTEFSGGPKTNAMSDINNALFSTRVFIGDVCWGGMNRWFYWYGFFGTRQNVYADGRVRWMTTMDQTQALMYGDGYTEPKKTLLGVSLSTIWKNVPVGSYVYRCTTNDDDLVNKHALKADLIAFKNNKSTVLVSINNTGKEKHYNFNNLTGSSAKIYSVTKDTRQEAAYVKRNVVDGSIKDFKCEPMSVNIVVTQNDDISEPNITFDFDNSVVEKDGKYYTAQNDVKIKGTLDEKAALYVNGEETELDENNNFEVLCDIEKKNPVVFECTDQAGNKSKKITLDFEYQKDFINILPDKTNDVSTDNQYTLTGSVNKKTTVYCEDAEYETNENGEFENVPPYYHWFACGGLTGSDFADPHVKVRDQGPITMVPLYSDDGGMTAAVTSYVAINRSTKHADEAFFLADLLLRKETQLSSALYSEWLVYNDSVGIPVYADAMQDTSPVTWHGMTDWHMSAENYENFSAARSQITRVRFQGGLEEALVNCYYACSDARYQDPNADLAPIIAEWYKTMEQWVQE